MLRPERMSRVSVTGSTQVMDDVIEAIHGMHLLHLTDYDDTWEGFAPGDPIEGADEASEKLVTVRSLQSILDVDEADAAPERIVTTDALDNELESIRQTVNELDDRRSELTDDLRAVNDRIETMEPFAALGIDLDLLSGYDSLSVAVGEGDPAAVETTLSESGVTEYELFEEDGVVAVFARRAEQSSASNRAKPGDITEQSSVSSQKPTASGDSAGLRLASSRALPDDTRNDRR